MTPLPTATSPRQFQAAVVENRPASTGLIHLVVECDHPLEFLPGQFAMLNFTGPSRRTFGRPFSILAAAGQRVEFLYRVVGGGTADLARLGPSDGLTVLGPLGRPFPAPQLGRPSVLVSGGVGLPPVLAWWHRYGSAGDQGYFGGRDPGDLPRELLPTEWKLSVDRGEGEGLFVGRVPDLAKADLADAGEPARCVLSCGPVPLLQAAARLAVERDWACYVSMEEHMGCGYGACKGCVVPLRPAPGANGEWRNATCCQEGPVFDAADLVWNRIV